MGNMTLTLDYDDLIDIFDSRLEAVREINVINITFNKKNKTLTFYCKNI